MAHRLASRFRDKGESTEDLRQVAALGLLKAIRRYDPARGPFEPFAIPTIRGELRRHFRDRTWDVRSPRPRPGTPSNRVRAAYGTGPRPRGACPTVDDLARQHTGLSEQQVPRRTGGARELAAPCPSTPGSGGADGDGPSPADFLGEPDHAFPAGGRPESVKEAVRRLPVA
ncbi:hypothetical protein LV779_26850 [Streptomyces thinghirensis]|nr:hypothetical protein [Streptomyces thinghirensis]